MYHDVIIIVYQNNCFPAIVSSSHTSTTNVIRAADKKRIPLLLSGENCGMQETNEFH